ncbi:MAG: hypothetical protein JXA13_11240 [Anaerolineales bacterium]|nr:hypothetical protein [Anaerolineales bacterium]
MDEVRRTRWWIVAGFLTLVFLVLIAGSSVAAPVRDLFWDDAASTKPQILFIGNSYTYTNDFPTIFSKLNRSGGHEIRVAARVPGGWSLDDHAHSDLTLYNIREASWDYVVLQEQSVLSALPAEREGSMYPAVRLLNQEIKAVGARTILFMTWGRRDGLPEEGFEDFDDMQTEVTSGYEAVAGELDILVAPVGLAWQTAIEREPELDLWQADGSHPSLEGSYLAACVFYAFIFQESPVGLDYLAGLELSEALFLQVVAAETVLR